MAHLAMISCDIGSEYVRIAVIGKESAEIAQTKWGEDRVPFYLLYSSEEATLIRNDTINCTGIIPNVIKLDKELLCQTAKNAAQRSSIYTYPYFYMDVPNQPLCALNLGSKAYLQLDTLIGSYFNLLRDAFSTPLLNPTSNVVIPIVSSFDDRQRDSLSKALQVAGVGSVSYVNEFLCISSYLNKSTVIKTKDLVIIICGASSLRIGLIRYDATMQATLVDSVSDEKCSGNAVDVEIVTDARKQYKAHTKNDFPRASLSSEEKYQQYVSLLNRCKHMKESIRPSMIAGFDFFELGVDDCSNFFYSVHYSDYVVLCKKCVGACQALLTSFIQKNQLNDFSYTICGGASRILPVQECITSVLTGYIYLPISDVDTAVVKGALYTQMKHLKHSYSTYVNGDVPYLLAKRGDLLPYNREFVFVPGNENQASMCLDLYKMGKDDFDGKLLYFSILDLASFQKEEAFRLSIAISEEEVIHVIVKDMQNRVIMDHEIRGEEAIDMQAYHCRDKKCTKLCISYTYYEGEIKHNQPDGLGRLFDYKKRLLYEGEWKNGIIQGQGVYIRNGMCYEGSFVDNCMCGDFYVYEMNKKSEKRLVSFGGERIVIPSSNENVKVDVEMAESEGVAHNSFSNEMNNTLSMLMHASSTLGVTQSQKEPSIESGFQYDYLLPNHRYYRGSMANDKPNGLGCAYSGKSQLIYQGSFVDGVYQGNGTLYSDGAMRYCGSFSKGKPEGFGFEFDADTHISYYGQFKNGHHDGVGTLYFTDGKIQYRGHFVNNEYDGYGQLWEEGGRRTYEGGFKMGKKYGKGISSCIRDGKTVTQYDGCFINDVFDGVGKLYDEKGCLAYDGEFEGGMRQGIGYVLDSKNRKHYGFYHKDRPIDHALLAFTQDIEPEEDLEMRRIIIKEYYMDFYSNISINSMTEEEARIHQAIVQLLTSKTAAIGLNFPGLVALIDLFQNTIIYASQLKNCAIQSLKIMNYDYCFFKEKDTFKDLNKLLTMFPQLKELSISDCEIRSLVISNDELDFLTSLVITGCRKLESITFGDRCAKKVERLVIANSPKLESITIGKESITEYSRHAYSSCTTREEKQDYLRKLNYTKVFRLSGLYNLKTLLIGDYCFIEYRQFCIENLSNLTTIRIGVQSFWNTKQLIMETLPSLKSVEFGAISFKGAYSFQLHNLDSLEDVHFGKNSFYDTVNLDLNGLSNLKQLVFEESSFSNVITCCINDLPSLQSLVAKENTMGSMLSLFLNNIPKLEQIQVAPKSLTGHHLQITANENTVNHALLSVIQPNHSV